MKGFCPLEVKIIQFPNGFHLNRLRKNIFYYDFFTVSAELFLHQKAIKV